MVDAQIVVRIAAAQLSGLSRNREIILASPFTGLLKRGGPGFMSYAVAEKPGQEVHELGDSLCVLREAFAPTELRFELIDEARPGAVEALLAAGLAATGRYPLLTLESDDLIMPPTPAGATVHVAESKEDAVDAQVVAGVAFGSEGERTLPRRATRGTAALRWRGWMERLWRRHFGSRWPTGSARLPVWQRFLSIATEGSAPWSPPRRSVRPSTWRGPPGLVDPRPRWRGPDLPAGGVRTSGDRGPPLLVDG